MRTLKWEVKGGFEKTDAAVSHQEAALCEFSGEFKTTRLGGNGGGGSHLETGTRNIGGRWAQAHMNMGGPKAISSRRAGWSSSRSKLMRLEIYEAPSSLRQSVRQDFKCN